MNYKMTELDKEVVLGKLFRDRSKHIEEHALLTMQIKLLGNGLRETGNILLTNLESRQEIQTLVADLLSLSTKQERTEVLSAYIAEANATLETLGIPVNGI
jgi:hypothetical protein